MADIFDSLEGSGVGCGDIFDQIPVQRPRVSRELRKKKMRFQDLYTQVKTGQAEEDEQANALQKLLGQTLPTLLRAVRARLLQHQ